MNLFVAFLRLVRVLNLFFIVLTQALFYYCVIPFAFKDVPEFSQLLTEKLFWLLSFASVLIAAAGYVINDYFDVNIDQINKPEKLVVNKIINRRWTILWHWAFSFAGVLISFYVSWKIGNWLIGFVNLGCVLILLLYSTSFKKRLLIGNLIIAVLTSWVVVVLLVVEWRPITVNNPELIEAMSRLFKLGILYGSFAFIISLVREVVKDIEDMQGDAKYNCKTMPIVWGVNVAKMFAGVWLIVLTASIIIVQFYILPFRWWWNILYSVVLVIIPLIWILIKLYMAVSKADYHRLSNAIKFVMLTGILTMIFFKFYS